MPHLRADRGSFVPCISSDQSLSIWPGSRQGSCWVSAALSVQTPGPWLTSSVTGSGLLPLSVPQFPDLGNGADEQVSACPCRARSTHLERHPQVLGAVFSLVGISGWERRGIRRPGRRLKGHRGADEGILLQTVSRKKTDTLVTTGAGPAQLPAFPAPASPPLPPR